MMNWTDRFLLHPGRTIGLAVSVGMASLVLPMVAAAATPGDAAADDNGAAQKIYLDPNTGNVLSAPPAGEAHSADTNADSTQQSIHPDSDPAQQKAQAAGKTSGNPSSSRYTPWQTEDGVQMLAVHPDNDPAERVVRCADGSLRMGHVQNDEEATDDQALCAAGDK